MREYLLAAGVMTGNSLDTADLVLTKFETDGSLLDLCALSLPFPRALSDALRALRQCVNECGGGMRRAVEVYATRCASSPYPSFDALEEGYTKFVADGVAALRRRAETLPRWNELGPIDLVGAHGQTCAHVPPSIAKSNDPVSVYTVQIGDGQKLADRTGITVVYDLRSDDIMNGGEGAPLAPLHHKHLAEHSKRLQQFPIAFCNAGNTGNISVISQRNDGRLVSLGWDSGPFNNYPDALMREEANQAFDRDGAVGRSGAVVPELLRLLFKRGVITRDGDNFLLRPPPRSSDPQWYVVLDELGGRKPVQGLTPSFADRLRTAEYFSAYSLFFSLTLLPESIAMPRFFALCGGGWKNPVIREHFAALLRADESQSPLLEEHRGPFAVVRKRIAAAGGSIEMHDTEHFGFDGTAMEARILADAAVSRVRGDPFTVPETSGASRPTVAGLIRFPRADRAAATPALREWLMHFGSEQLTLDRPEIFDRRWSRAAGGWYRRLKNAAAP